MLPPIPHIFTERGKHCMCIIMYCYIHLILYLLLKFYLDTKTHKAYGRKGYKLIANNNVEL